MWDYEDGDIHHGLWAPQDLSVDEFRREMDDLLGKYWVRPAGRKYEMQTVVGKVARAEWNAQPESEEVAMVSEIDRLRAERDSLLDVVFDAFNQACQVAEKTPDGRFMYDHCCISTYEHMAFLLVRAERIQPDQLVRPI